MLLLESKRIFCLTKCFYFHFVLNQLQLWSGEEAGAGDSWCVEMGGSNTRNSGAAGAAAEVPIADGQRVWYPEESRIYGAIQWKDRPCPAHESRILGKEGMESTGEEWSKRKCWTKAAARPRAKRRKEQCWSQKPFSPKKISRKCFFKSVTVQE